MVMIVKWVDVLLHHQQRPTYAKASAGKVKREKERKVDTKLRASPQQDFYLFFIWQAIVRGQLFLQWTFFLL
jgi:hypothetical protein